MQFSDFVAEFMHGLCILELFYAFPDAPFSSLIMAFIT